MLLHWCTLEPSGDGNLAAIRFSSPVRVQSIRIFPKDARPFAQHHEIVSETEPQAFLLHLYFSAYRVARPDSKEKPKPTNALAPTALAYAGGEMEFAVPMGNEYATRLIIVRGNFERVSMAIYGDVMSELPPPPTTYEPKPLPTFEPTQISRALDPSNSLDPSALARELLNLIPDAPPLPLAIRLVFCLKPPSDDWDLPEFPYIFAELDADTADLDLEKASALTTRPVSDDVEDEVLLRFADSMGQLTREKGDNQAFRVASILSNAASQHPNMAKSLLDKLDVPAIFDSNNMDESILIRLRDAATNADIARHLNSDYFLQTLHTITKDANADPETQSAATKLIARIQGWAVLEDTLSNTQGDFVTAATLLKENGTEEAALGVWLESMITHEDIAATLREIPLMPIPLPHPPYLFGSLKSSISHDEFVAFLRAVIGVAAVLAVYAFADAWPHTLCRERALAIIRLWQGVNGYREIVNHLLVLKQMIFRLDCMMDSDPPRRAGVDAEHILVNLAKDPQAILQPDFIDCILGLKAPLAVITEEERMSMRRAAIVADDGLPGAVDELLRPMDRPPTLKHLRAMRVAFAVIDDELRKDREYDVLRDFWHEGSRGLVGHLADIFGPLVNEIKSHFALIPPARKSQEVMSGLFRVADELLKLLLRLFPSYSLPSRAVRVLTASVADLFVCTDAADVLYSQTSPPCVAAEETRQSCIDVVRMLSTTSAQEGVQLGAEVVLKTLLRHGLHVEQRDPVHHLLQVLCLIDYLLPMPDAGDENETMWTQRVMPLVLQELWQFCRVLDTENKVHFVKRLSSLDRGVIGVAEWLIVEELKELLHVLRLLEDPTVQLHERVVRQYQVTMALNFLLDLAQPSSTASRILTDCLATVPEATSTMTSCILSILDQRLSAPGLTEVVQTVTTQWHRLDAALRAVLAIAMMRFVGSDDNPDTSTLDDAVAILTSTSIPDNLLDLVHQELDAVLDRYGRNTDAWDATSCQRRCLPLLDWRISTSKSTSESITLNITASAWTDFSNRMQNTVSTGDSGHWDSLKERVTVQHINLPSPPIPLPESIELSLEDVEDLLQPQIPVPSTPPRRALNQDVLGLVTISPPALIRSPASTGLTKTYSNNDFRQLRQTPSARQNTSRLPSMHVDVGVAMVV
ncbi:uncharacterized protein C8Q71DRAFT_712127 [Rhodofomes roseus]|uniref:Virilizer N-terminal domain-containing protein n=1 Tax=Rhodofomes roseus TaxID=34475 RepID=A0ABQ8K8Y1_9APHY|nr:uncharacterized protein C8Q71DRAFT_712127 [Rhodofomes roseus]KAH9833677.1 hypothetical protein C8Q71DRAFT_712127 [Rhodofomes roseus]